MPTFIRTARLTPLVALLASACAHAAPAPAPERPHCLLVTSRDTGELVLVRSPTLAVAARIAVGEGPHEVVASADGRLAYVANYGSQQSPGDSISVVDLDRGRETHRIDLGALRRPHGLALLDDALFVTAEVNRAVARIDLATRTVADILGLGVDVAHMLDVSADGSRVYTTNMLSGTITEVKPSPPGALPPLRHLATPGHPEGLALSPDGRTLWVGRNQPGLISVIDTASWSVTAEIPGGQVPFRIRFSPDGSRVAVADPAGGELRLYDADSHDLLHAIALPAPAGVVFSPDGRRIYTPLLQTQAIAQVDVATGALMGQSPTGPISDGIAIAPRDCTPRSRV
jgi:YVTN family beta-propeller protein